MLGEDWFPKNKDGTIRIEPAKPWGEFFAKFTPPKDLDSLYDRIQTNFMYYQRNYLFVAGFFSLFAIFSKPQLLLVIPTLIAIWYFVLLAISKKRIRISGSFTVSREIIGIAAIIVSILLMIFSKVMFAFLLTTGISSFFILLHAILRSRNLKSATKNFTGKIKEEVSDVLRAPAPVYIPSDRTREESEEERREEEERRRKQQEVLSKHRATAQRIREKYALSQKKQSRKND
eukprot:gb/GECH01007258.1/.p1 GENE.gb/GECH01007258.1/~~gb/GECH01007258.1/.p1  ORF type:complete len:232 (+),score=46.89 gb/GECH01007258.1/:1-696(+)